ncbi:hypothetical protein JK358_37355 [Nocardia sp. 2]|uniref:Uncharacterized protein n=1 Tax=Nocardia acididurans TaxID=2802282 RepID=A0ABS1MJ55_9NOCA|nr:hypothetical protein [Nocardia acididurans]MBL1080080.1 hypothetical protein [Nocardia acididurans]
MITEVVLAVEDLVPVAPPGSKGLLMLAQYGKWLAYLVALCGIVYGGGRFAVEKWSGGACESPKVVAASIIGGIIVAVSTTLLNTVVSAV